MIREAAGRNPSGNLPREDRKAKLDEPRRREGLPGFHVTLETSAGSPASESEKKRSERKELKERLDVNLVNHAVRQEEPGSPRGCSQLSSGGGGSEVELLIRFQVEDTRIVEVRVFCLIKVCGAGRGDADPQVHGI
ncbi:hypothetical protein EYF80_024209 [Liparis tanakae]|uniref:Uncharacterized protein n=1 Tax=Liparis tanakae TaxID=230148 RepID=A0A4Z2HIW5_9TELE|nr:hypothetical protein EYF80_024209 [Liparis tanakae]